MVALLTTLMGLALATPYRAPSMAAHLPRPEDGSEPQRVVIKLAEQQGLSFVAGRLSGPPDDLHARIADAAPLFSRARAALFNACICARYGA